jgi:predicted flap endonuclease-1-like 5' DNA nuclease
MVEIASQIVLNLFIALFIGICIGYIIAKVNITPKDDSFRIKYNEPKKSTKDNLKKIKGIDSKLEFELNRMGITTFKQISEWTKEDCTTIGSSIDAENSIEEFSWVEQAKILAAGDDTIYSKKVENKEINIA